MALKPVVFTEKVLQSFLRKTECFLYPIVRRCLRLRDEGATAGISAVIVYPTNALAENS